MNLNTLSSRQFNLIVKLLKKRTQIVAQVENIERKLEALGGIPTNSPTAKLAKTKAAKKQSLKEVVLQVLSQAPAKGFSVPEIAKATGRPQGSLSVWFYTAAKKIKGVKRVAPGRFIYKA